MDSYQSCHLDEVNVAPCHEACVLHTSLPSHRALLATCKTLRWKPKGETRKAIRHIRHPRKTSKERPWKSWKTRREILDISIFWRLHAEPRVSASRAVGCSHIKTIQIAVSGGGRDVSLHYHTEICPSISSYYYSCAVPLTSGGCQALLDEVFPGVVPVPPGHPGPCRQALHGRHLDQRLNHLWGHSTS